MTAYIDLRGRILLYTEISSSHEPTRMYLIKIPLHYLVIEYDFRKNTYVHIAHVIDSYGFDKFRIEVSHELYKPEEITPELIETVGSLIPDVTAKFIKNYVHYPHDSLYISIYKSIVIYLDLH